MFQKAARSQSVVHASQIDNDPAFEGTHVLVPIILYLNKTTLDGLCRYSMFPLYISMANLSWEFYNERAGMKLCALLPIVEPDAKWPGAGYKSGSDEHKDLKQYIQHSSLSIVTESARLALYTGFDFTDPTGVPRKGVPQIFVIQKDLGEAGHIFGVKASHCDSCMVPPEQLNELRKGVDPGWPARTEADMKKVIQEMLDIRETPGSTKATVKALVDEHGVHPQMMRTKCPRPGARATFCG
jgi:hypothetical protein